MAKDIIINDLHFGKGIPIICTPLTGETIDSLLSECKVIHESNTDIVEWRVDFFQHALEIEMVLEALPKIREALHQKPILFSFRTAREGGEKEISVENYLALNKAVIASGYVQLIDIELFIDEKVLPELLEEAKLHDVYSVVSNHDFTKTPSNEQIHSIMKRALEFGADIPKLAVMPQSEEDVLRILSVNLQLKREYPKQPIIMIAMGRLGVISRISGELFGSALTFASAEKASAPGQVSVHQLKGILQIMHDTK